MNGGNYAERKKRIPMSKKVLLVDDEPNVLSAVKRQLRKKIDISTAESGREALSIIKNKGPFAVIISDMRMPEMDGIELLKKVKKAAPETVRMMLTGNADQQTAIDAVNQGSIFRFMTKPCAPELLEKSVAAGLEQHRLITAEKELLNKTLNGTIKVLTEILSLVNPAAFSRAYRIKNLVREIAKKLNLPNLWQYQIAALLSQIGCITVPSDTLNKMYDGIGLTSAEEEMFKSHPAAGAKLLGTIPRLGNISRIIEEQQQPYKKFAVLPHDPNEETVIVGGQLLHLAVDYDQLLFIGYSHEKACKTLEQRPREYNPDLLAALKGIEAAKMECVTKRVRVMELHSGMTVNQNVLTKNGILIVAKGQEVSYTVIQRLRNFAGTIGVVEPIEVTIFQKQEES